MRVLVLGGAGFIGSELIRQLLALEYQIRVLDRNECPIHFGGVEWVKSKISNEAVLASALSDVDIVVHLISASLPANSMANPIFDIEENLITSVKLIKLIENSSVKKIIYASSGGTVYGEPLYLPIDEDHPTNPLVPYGITKLAIEKHLLALKKRTDIKVCILRISNPFGISQKRNTGQGIIGILISKIINNEEIELWGSGNILRDYISISDVIDAFVCAIKYEGSKSIFNIGSGIGHSLGELINILEAASKLKLKIINKKARIFDVKKNIMDISLAKREMGWSPKRGVEAEIERFYKIELSKFNE